MFEGVDLSQITVGIAAVALAYWAMRHFVPSEREAYQALLKADREAWANEREANQTHVQEIVKRSYDELALSREQREEERKALERIIREVLIALTQAGVAVTANGVQK